MWILRSAAPLLGLAISVCAPLVASAAVEPAAATGRQEGEAAEPQQEPAPKDDHPVYDEFPEQTFRLFARRPVNYRFRPNVGIPELPLRPRFSPYTADYEGRPRSSSGPLFSILADVTLLDVDGGRDSAKGQEFRDLSRGVAVGLDAWYRTERAWYRLTGRHLLKEDQDALFEVRSFGVLSAEVSWSEIPHNYAFGATSLYGGIGSGRLEVDDGVQTFLQGSTSDVDAADRLRQVLASQATPADLSHTRDRLALELDLIAFDPLAVELVHKRESREGVRPWSGSFGYANVVEIPWPVDYETDDSTVTVEWARGDTLVRGSYRRAEFTNEIPTVSFDNPWRIEDSAGSIRESYGVGPVAGLIDLYPDNRQDEQTLTAVQHGLPGKSHLMATVSWSQLEQDDPLVPYTTNTAILEAPDPPPFDPSDPANRPAPSGRAELDTRLVHLRWTARPTDRLELKAEFRDWELDNETEQIFTPGLSLEDSAWRNFFGEPDGAFSNLPIAYRTTTLGLELGYEVAERTELKLSYENEDFDREFREVRSSDEDRYKVSLDSKPLSWLDLRISYLRHERRAEEYDFDQFYRNQGMTFLPVLPFLFKYDQASRDRDRLQLIASFYPTPSLVLGAQVIDGSDEYPESPFGVQGDDHRVYVGDLSYLFGDRASIFASYSVERYELDMLGREWIAFGPGDPYRTEPGLESDSNWRAETRDDVDTWTVGLDVSLIPDRLHFDLAYSYSTTDGRIDYSSPVGEIDNNPYVPAPFEQVDDVDFYNVNPRLEYRFDEHRAIAVGYLRERYELSDFATEGFQLVPTTPGGALNGALFMGSFPFDFDLEAYYVQVRLAF